MKKSNHQNSRWKLLNSWGREKQWNAKGAWKSCRSRHKLSNEYLSFEFIWIYSVAKVGFDRKIRYPVQSSPRTSHFNLHNFTSPQGFNFRRAVVSPESSVETGLFRFFGTMRWAGQRLHFLVQNGLPCAAPILKNTAHIDTHAFWYFLVCACVRHSTVFGGLCLTFCCAEP